MNGFYLAFFQNNFLYSQIGWPLVFLPVVPGGLIQNRYYTGRFSTKVNIHTSACSNKYLVGHKYAVKKAFNAGIDRIFINRAKNGYVSSPFQHVYSLQQVWFGWCIVLVKYFIRIKLQIGNNKFFYRA